MLPECLRPSDPPPAWSGSRSPVEVAKRAGGLVREIADPPGTPKLVPHPWDHPHPPRVRSGKQHFGSHPAGSQGPPPSSQLRRACVPAGGPPERARSPRPRRRTPSRRLLHLSGSRRADWACSGARPRAVGAERMHSPGRGLAVQGRGAQAAALADALASLRRTRARMASLTAYGTAGKRASRAGRASRSRHPR